MFDHYIAGEYQLTDAMDMLCRENALYAAVVEGPRFDVGSPLGYIKATVEYALRRKDLRDSVRNYLMSLS